MSETLHGTAVLVGPHGVLIRGEPGAGKSVLAYALIARGGRLVADDRVLVSARNGCLVASAPACIAGLMELRGRGLISLAHERFAVIRLVADIVSDAALERMPEPHDLSTAIGDITIARQPIPAGPEAGIRLIEAALTAL